ncbi:arginine--tRNA ligase, partial [Patescibacteria group bacterium]|nr:arginine--tRNA ligase [Patescibacteria group bacterium]
KKILLEHTSPNPQTTIMLGHLRNNFLGMAVSRILEFSGAEVKKDCIVNDRGIHLSKALWGYLVFAKKGVLKESELLEFKKISDKRLGRIVKKVEWENILEKWSAKRKGWLTPSDLNLKPDHTNLIWYVLGSRAYESYKNVKSQISEMLVSWEEKNKKIIDLWEQIMEWSREGYEKTYKRIGSEHDWFWKESDHFQKGKEIIEKGLKKGVFKKSEGAVVTDLAKYSLSDTIVSKSDGTALYITQDIALTELKKQKFPSDLYIWDVGSEQKLYLKQLFAVCEQLGIGKRDQFFHLDYALINFKGKAKMSTRKGDVVKADEVLDLLKTRAKAIIKSSNQDLRAKLKKSGLEKLAEDVSLGAVKYSLLKHGRNTVMQFDIDESLELEGNSASYIQYTFARACSVLEKAKEKDFTNFSLEELEEEELDLLRVFYKFGEVVEEASRSYAVSLICNFLFDLAQKYNIFYTNCPILESSQTLKKRRLALTGAASQIIKNGLTLLGIKALEKM